MRLRGEHCRQLGAFVTALSMLSSTAWAQGPAPSAKPKPGAAMVGTSAPTPPVRPATPPNPKKLLVSAQAKRAAGDYAAALADYQAADSVAATPATVEGIAFCHDKLGHFDEALTWYEGFLSDVPIALQLEGNEARARVDAIKAMPGHLHLESVPSNAVVSVDGKEQPTHTPVDVELAPGGHKIHLVAEGHDAIDKDVEIASRTKANLVLEPPATPPPPPPPPVVLPPPPPPPPPPRSVIPAIIVGGLAVVGAGVGIGGGIAALSDKSTFNSHPTTATANAGESAALVADMGFGIGITLGVTAIVLYVTRNEPSSPLPTASPEQSTTPAAPAGHDVPASTPPPKASSASPLTFTAAPFMTAHGGGAGALLRF